MNAHMPFAKVGSAFKVSDAANEPRGREARVYGTGSSAFSPVTGVSTPTRKVRGSDVEIVAAIVRQSPCFLIVHAKRAGQGCSHEGRNINSRHEDGQFSLADFPNIVRW